MTQTLHLPIGDIAWIDDLPYRPIDKGHIQALVAANEPDTWPPIIVTPGAYGDGRHYGLVAGQHRTLAGVELKCPMILAQVKEYSSSNTMYLDMWEDNAKHGLTYSIAERKEHAVTLHYVYPELSYREIGRRAGINDITVKRAIEQYEKQDEEEPDNEQRAYNADMQAPAQRFISAFNKFVDTETHLFGSKYSDRNVERRARALARYVKGDASAQALRALASTFNLAAQYVEEKRAKASR